MTVKEFMRSIPPRLKWSLTPLTIFVLLFTSAILPLTLYGNPQWFVEHGPVENLQLVVLVCAFAIAVSAKQHKKFYVCLALLIVLMLMRETNLGRGFFCEKYLSPDELCRWKSMKYGVIVEPLRNLYGIYILWYAFKDKLHRDFIAYAQKAPLFMFDFILLLAGALTGTVAEFHNIDNEVLEESGEMLFYLAFTDVLWRYSRLKTAI